MYPRAGECIIMKTVMIMSIVMTCYIAAGCVANCVLGYDNICYVNMLHVFSCTLFAREKHLNKNINTGYPALDPTANKYLSGSGWEIMYLCFVLNVVSLVLCFSRSFFCVCLLLYVFVRL